MSAALKTVLSIWERRSAARRVVPALLRLFDCHDKTRVL